MLITTPYPGASKDAGINSVGDEVCILRGLALVVLIVGIPALKTMSHDNGNFSSLEAAVARPES